MNTLYQIIKFCDTPAISSDKLVNKWHHTKIEIFRLYVWKCHTPSDHPDLNIGCQLWTTTKGKIILISIRPWATKNLWQIRFQGILEWLTLSWTSLSGILSESGLTAQMISLGFELWNSSEYNNYYILTEISVQDKVLDFIKCGKILYLSFFWSIKQYFFQNFIITFYYSDP